MYYIIELLVQLKEIAGPNMSILLQINNMHVRENIWIGQLMNDSLNFCNLVLELLQL
jgi:hypothetical protein